MDIIPGYLDKATLQEYVTCSDAVLLPFRLVPSEPPLSMFEAMLWGKTVVTSNIGGLREIVGSNRGVVVGASNADELADALLFLSKNPKRRTTLGLNAQKYAKTLPNWNEVTDIFMKILLGTQKTQSQLTF